MKSLDLDALSTGDRYRLVSGCITPRPIAWVSSISPQGRVNLAPFSFFNAMGCDPIVFVFSPLTEVNEGEERLKDTLRNVRSVEEGGTGEMVIHIVVESNLRQMAASAADLPPDESEVDFAGLTTAPSLKVRPPRIVESPIAFECKTLQVVRTNPGRAMSANIVIAEAVHAWIDETLTDDGFRVDQEALRTIGRVGGPNYATTRRLFSFGRGADALVQALPSELAPDTRDTR
ncbi:MAG: flavin reductase (DIM6/NTAB) family NADH-FMN oxidoreductase RutF [Polyangiales bacterium]|jgi:flavin reductase (DIM6/NTAB) family NADH-FMN oxidoreductase RutF